jgi:hypothetical protein
MGLKSSISERQRMPAKTLGENSAWRNGDGGISQAQPSAAANQPQKWRQRRHGAGIGVAAIGNMRWRRRGGSAIMALAAISSAAAASGESNMAYRIILNLAAAQSVAWRG